MPDPDDDIVVGTALAAQADRVVTGGRALLTVCGHAGVHIVHVGSAVVRFFEEVADAMTLSRAGD